MTTLSPIPPLCIPCSITSSSLLTNSNNLYNVDFAIQTEQFVNQGKVYYDGSSIKYGMWFANTNDGKAWRINSINITVSNYIFTGILEDVEYYNYGLTTKKSNNDIAIGPGYVFELCEDGLPNLVPINGIPANMITNLIGRFRTRNLYKYYVQVNQDHNFKIGDIIYLNTDGIYYKVTASNKLVNKALGVITCTNNNYYNSKGNLTEVLNYFSYRPFGNFITKNNNINLSGPKGTVFYIDINGNFTTTPSSFYSKPIYIIINDNNDLILLNDSYNENKNKSHKITIYCINGILSSFTVDNSISDINKYPLSSSTKDITFQINSNFKLPNTITIWGRQFKDSTDITKYTSYFVQNTNLTIETSDVTFSMKAYSYSNLVTLLGIFNPPLISDEYIVSEIYLNIYD